MSCDEYKQDLSAYMDGELDAQRRGEIDEHLEACDDCRGELDRLRKLTAVLRGTPRAKAPASLAKRIAEAAKNERAPKTLRIRRWVPFLATAAAVMLAAVIGFSGRRESDSYSPRLGSERPARSARRPAAASKADAPDAVLADAEPKAADDVAAEMPVAPARGPGRAPGAVAARPRPAAPEAMKYRKTAQPAERRAKGGVEFGHERGQAERATETLVGRRVDALPPPAAATPAGQMPVVARDAAEADKLDAAPPPAPTRSAAAKAESTLNMAAEKKKSDEPMLVVEVQAADGAAEQLRIVRIAREVGGAVSAPTGGRPVAKKAATRAARTQFEVRVPGDRTNDFLARLEGLTLDDELAEGGERQRGPGAVDRIAAADGAAEPPATPAPRRERWTRIQVSISAPTSVATTGAKEAEGRADADEVEMRMNRLLAGRERTAQVTSAPKHRGSRIGTVMRFHLPPFRGDVAREVDRVKRLAVHYGGRDLLAEAAAKPMRRFRGGQRDFDQPVELRFTMPLAVAPEFIKASRLGFTPPAAGRDAPLKQPARPAAGAGQPQRWVTVIVTVGDADPAAADEGRR